MVHESWRLGSIRTVKAEILVGGIGLCAENAEGGLPCNDPKEPIASGIKV
jgi:hypothetical protein